MLRSVLVDVCEPGVHGIIGHDYPFNYCSGTARRTRAKRTSSYILFHFKYTDNKVEDRQTSNSIAFNAMNMLMQLQSCASEGQTKQANWGALRESTWPPCAIVVPTAIVPLLGAQPLQFSQQKTESEYSANSLTE